MNFCDLDLLLFSLGKMWWAPSGGLPTAARAPLGVRDYARGPPPFAPLLSSHGLSPFASEPGVAAASATSPAFTPVEALEHGQASTTSTKKDAAAMLTMMMNMAAAAAPALEQENRVAL